jgi:hypothetical protein
MDLTHREEMNAAAVTSILAADGRMGRSVPVPKVR